jgi:hypothetical protein
MGHRSGSHAQAYQPLDVCAYKYFFRTGDTRQCRLYNLRLVQKDPTKGPLLMIAGVGVRANIFRPPGQVTLVDLLLEEGYDVWLLDWRACIEWGANPPPWPKQQPGGWYSAGLINLDDLSSPPPWPEDLADETDPEELRWCLDHAALYDHPYAVRAITEITKHATIKAVVHCLGSIGFMMAAVQGLLPQVTTVVSNAVSLHPVVPWWTDLKCRLSRSFVSKLVAYLDSQWGTTEAAPNWLVKLVLMAMQWGHFECMNLVCKLASFSYGVGLPTLPVLWRHENLSPEVHQWIKYEFGKVLMEMFKQLERSWQYGNMVRLADLKGLPEDYASQEPKTGDTRIAFFAGELNVCWLKESQERSFDFFNKYRPNYHSLHILPGYSHLDMFIGKYTARDVFPLMLEELRK